MINIAIIGAGNIAKTHIDAYLDHPELCRITAVCNRHVEKAQKLIDTKKLDAKAYAGLEDALLECEIDAVSICLPPDQHADAAISAAEHGLHCLCEKPLANSLADCDRMIAAAEKNSVLLASVCQLRFSTTAQRIHKLIEEERFGKIVYANCTSMWWRGSNYHDLDWRGTWAKEGGGVLTIQAIHHLDLMQYMLGMPEKVTAVQANVGHFNSECEDVVTAIFEYPGKFAQFSAAQVAHGEHQQLEFYAERGRLAIPWDPAVMKAMPNGFPEDDSEGCEELDAAFKAIPEREFQDHSGQVLNFLRAIAGEEKLISDGYEGRKVIELITAVYKSAYTGSAVALPMQKDDPFYTAEGKASLMPHYHEKKVSVGEMAEGYITFAR